MEGVDEGPVLDVGDEAPVSQELLDTIDRHGKSRTAQVRDVIVEHPDVRVGDPGVAAGIILFTVEMNTHTFMAAPRTVPSKRSRTSWSRW
ncbi:MULTISPECIES: hypothetical protein [Streptomyces]|uniref:hypothetical protein n=1 Tax=Streptomyces TaxID=1883 RepID=UPI001F2D7083|nr:hypothetical protein [Streptomyces lycii]